MHGFVCPVVQVLTIWWQCSVADPLPDVSEWIVRSDGDRRPQTESLGTGDRRSRWEMIIFPAHPTRQHENQRQLLLLMYMMYIHSPMIQCATETSELL